MSCFGHSFLPKAYQFIRIFAFVLMFYCPTIDMGSVRNRYLEAKGRVTHKESWRWRMVDEEGRSCFRIFHHRHFANSWRRAFENNSVTYESKLAPAANFWRGGFGHTFDVNFMMIPTKEKLINKIDKMERLLKLSYSGRCLRWHSVKFVSFFSRCQLSSWERLDSTALFARFLLSYPGLPHFSKSL